MSVAIVIPTYNGVERVRFFLTSVVKHDPEALNVPWLIVEDPCGQDSVAKNYDGLSSQFDIPVWHLEEWSNMHGAAKKAFQIAFNLYEPDWIIYLGDDLACTPGALSNLIHFITENPLETVSLVQPAYWNAHDLQEDSESEWAKLVKDPVFTFDYHKEFYKSDKWIDRVHTNPYWQYDKKSGLPEGCARSYVNVNGVGFACKASTYRDVGGFADGTWCLDESLSVRTWLNSDQSIVSLPGPPLVHLFGASTVGHHAKHDLMTEEAWVRAMGHSKYCLNGWSYAKMFERKPAVDREMLEASYFE